MQYIPCNSALLAQEILFLTQKGTFFAQRSPKSALIATNLNSRQNSVCSGLKFSSKSKLFGGAPPCHRTTSATLHLREILIWYSVQKWRKDLLTNSGKSMEKKTKCFHLHVEISITESVIICRYINNFESEIISTFRKSLALTKS